MGSASPHNGMIYFSPLIDPSLLHIREEAGYLRNVEGVHVRAVQRRTKRKAKARAYVVFVGREPAVYVSWYVYFLLSLDLI